MSIRSTAKAIIVNDGKVLINKCFDKYNGEYFSLPGGGQNTYETLYDAVIRECLEETGYTVSPARFAALCEEICDSEEFREKRPDYAHKMYHIFVCSLTDEERTEPTEKDELQIGSEWVDIDRLNGIRLLPKAVGDNILKIINSDSPLFLDSTHIPYNHG
ncbi:MAG: NUDIX domain-containing protein [Bacillota bacterium]|nr:NUDIX domain-containing protein [Bacillota bacterium]